MWILSSTEESLAPLMFRPALRMMGTVLKYSERPTVVVGQSPSGKSRVRQCPVW